MTGRSIHLVGSVPMANAQAVFEHVSAVLGQRLKRRICQSCLARRHPIQLIHMPVPRNRSDDAYFAPLRRLQLRPETELCLGLVHYTDGIEGSRRRLATARNYAPDFSVATECGFGRRDPRTIPELLRIHAEVADT